MAKDEVAAKSKMGKMMVSAGFKKRVMLPSVYYNKLKQEKSEWAILKTPKGEWEVKVRRDDNGDIFLEDGWPEFNDHDFMELEHTCNKMHFNVSVAVSAPLQNPNTCKGKAKKKDVVTPHNQWSFFEKKMTCHYVKKSAMLPISKKFVSWNDFEAKKKVMLMDHRGKIWPVELRTQNDLRCGKRIFMTKGFHDFCVANELKNGDSCKFILNPESPSTSTSYFHVHIN